jgi:hypothetical protein
VVEPVVAEVTVEADPFTTMDPPLVAAEDRMGVVTPPVAAEEDRTGVVTPPVTATAGLLAVDPTLEEVLLEGPLAVDPTMEEVVKDPLAVDSTMEEVVKGPLVVDQTTEEVVEDPLAVDPTIMTVMLEEDIRHPAIPLHRPKSHYLWRNDARVVNLEADPLDGRGETTIIDLQL